MNNNPLEETELIITERNTVYHLDLAPGELATTVITVGSSDRVKEVSKYFDKVTHKAQHREFITHTGYIGAKQISVISTGIGPGNIDIVFNEMDALVNIDFTSRTIKNKKTTLSIIRLGTCGALQEDIPIDSLLVSSYGVGLDNLLLYYDLENEPDEIRILNEFLKQSLAGTKNIHPYISGASASLSRHFGLEYIHGITASCPGFYGPQGRILRLPAAFSALIDHIAKFSYDGTRIVNFEMETAAIYGMGKLLGHECLSISAALANRATKAFSKNPDLAIDKMIKHSLEIIVGI